MTAYVVERVAAADTWALRHEVLRPHQRLAEMAVPGDDDRASGHFVARTPAGEVIGTASVLPEPPPWATEGQRAWRLRGMATAPGWRGKGVGTTVFAAALAHVGAHGGTLLWCNARIPAQAFYDRAGFVPHGEPWVDPVIGPHLAMSKTVRADG